LNAFFFGIEINRLHGFYPERFYDSVHTMVLSVRKEEITVQGKNRSESGGALNDIFP
jgi:hypothetical protein